MLKKDVPLRHELKYLISIRDYHHLRNLLGSGLKRDAHASEEGYWIRSLYFDDYSDSALYEKNMGVFERAKYRIRIYDESDQLIRLERKRKYNQQVSKEQFVMDRAAFDSLMAGDDHFLLTSGNEVAQDFYIKKRTHGLMPRAIVDYQREAYIMEVEEVRITFDKKLAAGTSSFGIFDSPLLTTIFPDESMILEVKYNRFLPQIVRQYLACIDARALALSKYVMCREAIMNREWSAL